MRWDVFCQVVDNYGDIGVCWRLSADLASRGHTVRLWVDDASALAWMAPEGTKGVTVCPWAESLDEPNPGDVVIEAFGCQLPEPFVARMASATRALRWINLEYLSAESYVERSHRLPSPQLHGPGRGLTKWFFYPGFTAATGGLLREPSLMAERAGFERHAWLQRQGIAVQQGERLVSLFAYESPALDSLLTSLGDAPTLLLLTAGRPVPAGLPERVRCTSLPYLCQPDYDRLLWSCDLNFVRGEDSFVRAQWAGKPFVWHIYPQDDGAHTAKLNAFLDKFPAVPGLRALWHAWNGLGPWPWQPVDPLSKTWMASCLRWREELLAQRDLTTQLVSLAAEAG
jgi:uncharacterized repeat protein (TIGR03837 family)